MSDNELLDYFYNIRRSCIESNHIGLQASVLVWSAMFSEYCTSKTHAFPFDYTPTDFTEYYFKLLVSTEGYSGHHYSNHLTLLNLFDEGNFTVLHNELLTLLVDSKQDGELYFDTKLEQLLFAGKLYKPKSRDEHSRFLMLLETMVKSPEKRWSQDEIIEDWGDFYDGSTRAAYDAAIGLNKKIAEDTTIKDFICYEGKKTLWINDKYLR
jgi:hypothetical protein